MPPRMMPIAMLAIMGVAFLWMTRPKHTGPEIENIPVLTAQDILDQHASAKVILVNFWATWCEPCTRELPLLVKISREWQSKGVHVVLVNLDDAKDDKGLQAIRSFTDRFKATHLTVFKDSADGFFAGLGIEAPQGLPYTALIDPKNHKSQVWFGIKSADEFELELAKFLK